MNSLFARNKWIKIERDKELKKRTVVHPIEEKPKKDHEDDALGKQLKKIKQTMINEIHRPEIVTTVLPSLFQEDSDVSFVSTAASFLSFQEELDVIQKEPTPVLTQPSSPSNGLSKRSPVQDLEYEREKIQRTSGDNSIPDEMQNNDEISLPSIPHEETEDYDVSDDTESGFYSEEEEESFESDDSGTEFEPSESSVEDNESYSDVSEYSDSEDSVVPKDTESYDSDFVVPDGYMEYRDGKFLYDFSGDDYLSDDDEATNADVLKDATSIPSASLNLEISQPVMTRSQSIEFPKSEFADFLLFMRHLVEYAVMSESNPQSEPADKSYSLCKALEYFNNKLAENVEKIGNVWTESFLKNLSQFSTYKRTSFSQEEPALCQICDKSHPLVSPIKVFFTGKRYNCDRVRDAEFVDLTFTIKDEGDHKIYYTTSDECFNLSSKQHASFHYTKYVMKKLTAFIKEKKKENPQFTTKIVCDALMKKTRWTCVCYRGFRTLFKPPDNTKPFWYSNTWWGSFFNV